MYEITTYQPVDYSLDSLFFSLLFSLIQACIFGAITHAINDAKGREGGFWWGFFLGVIGIIVVAVRPAEYGYYVPTGDGIYPDKASSKPIDMNAPVPAGGWRCVCGRVHEAYESSCSCGQSKRAVLAGTAKQTRFVPLSPPAPKPTKPQDWTCTCGKEHPSYETSCICGKTKHEVITANIVLPEPVAEPESNLITEAITDDEQTVQSLRRYKALLDEGVITQEDFEAKKKQLLGL